MPVYIPFLLSVRFVVRTVRRYSIEVHLNSTCLYRDVFLAPLGALGLCNFGKHANSWGNSIVLSGKRLMAVCRVFFLAVFLPNGEFGIPVLVHKLLLKQKKLEADVEK